MVTTHYSNIKLKADELPEASNGCMLFNEKDLSPLYQFSLGQPGSSFTFEVAQLNGISKQVILDAKQRLNQQKVRLDTLLSSLQKERNQLLAQNTSVQLSHLFLLAAKRLQVIFLVNQFPFLKPKQHKG